MLSRVAFCLYWMFRYLERAQNVARFVDSDFNFFLENPANQENLWNSLIAVTGDQAIFEDLYGTSYSRKNVFRFLTLDERYANSVLSALRASRENARSIRETIPNELWQELNTLYLSVQDYSRHIQPPDQEVRQLVMESCYKIIGQFYSIMSRNEAWHFARMGMLIERADKTSRILDVKYFLLLQSPDLVGSGYDNSQWAALLQSVSGLEMYRRTHRRLQPASVIEFLILEQKFPRSISHCVRYFTESLTEVVGTSRVGNRLDVERDAHRLRAELENTTVNEIIQYGLHEYLDKLQISLNRLDDRVYAAFFNPNAPSRTALPINTSQA